MSRAEIENCIPHRPPMLLVDEVIQRTSERIVCRKRFDSQEYFFQGHYPDYPLVPGVILCEACMQAGAILLAGHIEANTGVPVATRMNGVRFRKMVRPGDTIEMEVELAERVANAFIMKARAKREEDAVLRFEFTCTLADPRDGAPSKETA